jgi:hypothetical protein
MLWIAAVLNITVLWDVTPFSLVEISHDFGVVSCLPEGGGCIFSESQ